MPTIEPQQRPAALVLAIASRLAPLAVGDPDRELRAFLTRLPQRTLDATARLTTRTLPESERERRGSTDPARVIISRLQILQLVGTHRVDAS